MRSFSCFDSSESISNYFCATCRNKLVMRPVILSLAVFYLLVQVRQLRLAFVVARVASVVSAVVAVALVSRVVGSYVLAFSRVASAVVLLLGDHDGRGVISSPVFGSRPGTRAFLVLFRCDRLAPAFLSFGLRSDEQRLPVSA